MIKILENNIHTYTIEVQEVKKGTRYALFSSNNEIWEEQFRNKLLFYITDTADSLILKREITKNTDYDVISDFKLLLDYVMSQIEPKEIKYVTE